MNILGIIPARFASTRFPGKPLVDLGGKSMIQRVYVQAKKCNAFSDVLVATDDERIYDHVKKFGGKAIMTSATHPSGTDRCAEVLEAQQTKPDVVINIQGDEPFIDPNVLSNLAKVFEDPSVEIATLAKLMDNTEALFNPNVPKVILNAKQEAIYFSRAAIPYLRGVDASEWMKHHTYYKHIGIYAFRAEVLQKISKLKQTALEKAESLEQLRWIENGYKIKVALTTHESISIDTPADLEKAKLFL